MKTILLLLIPVLLFSFENGVSGIVTLGYGTLYGYEKEKFDGYQLRGNGVLFSNRLLAEVDFQGRVVHNTLSPLLYLGAGFRIVTTPKAPAVWVTGSWLYSDLLPLDQYEINEKVHSPGIGFVIGMQGDWLRSCFTNFSMSYYPREQALFKSMQIGWEFYKVGLSAGGTGIRFPRGRMYSSFLFSVRYAFGDWE